MLTEYVSSKEVIKSRMLRHALSYWGIRNTEDLDPLVKLILEALSLELYNLGNEVKDTQVRILEKISGLLSPDFLTAPSPAHAIMQAYPAEASEVLDATMGFVVQDNRPQDNGEPRPEAHFTPLVPVQLTHIQISHMATGSNLFSYEGSSRKRLQARGTKTRHMENGLLWLGLHLPPSIEAVDHLTFYFDWNSVEPLQAKRVYQYLSLSRWRCGQQELQATQGYAYPEIAAAPQEPTRFLESDLLSIITHDILQYYHPMFMGLGNFALSQYEPKMAAYPAQFTEHFAPSDLEQLTQPLLWVQVKFPEGMQQDLLNEVDVYLNAFPVMNRKHNDLKYRLKGGSNIIPLKTGAQEQFLAMHTLTDDTHTYRQMPYRKTQEEPLGTYTLRNGGTERFDSRNARELISYLMELLRSESAAFAAYGYDFIATTLKELNQKMALMEQKTRAYTEDAAEVPNYILVKPFDGKELLYAEYWTTLAELANNLRSGTQLQMAKGFVVKPGSAQLLTPTIGGKNRLRPEERLNAFRYGIMTRDRIITKEDIRNFCFYELGSRIKEVRVEKGYELSALPSESFTRTIDVKLVPNGGPPLDAAGWQVLCEQLRNKLRNRSGMSNNYRVMMAE
ncbi:hypothetical protein SAMN05444008_10136 [Cnuella takakiae]|uniref:Type VI secretion system baseplate subunit TssF n=1 Tax=Cnuella takakiae TaxID=1302690 RepID=A0A1M4S9V6_9BACT|nr:type VI secretion system baseplate subunit TssF [Cnuella takakiae]OLY94433.1 hypothetical protein BUE76_23040 [Cnuella takakiae]SHE28925.1 hypothetical protein SAMN05444008_10136 [Cnuella takakiae]